MKALRFAFRSLIRQPARSTLGVLGVAAVGALLFDMLLLSEGLIVSMRDLLDRTGYDVRITATSDLPRSGPRIDSAASTTKTIAALSDVRSALAIRFAEATIDGKDGKPTTASLEGVTGTQTPPWTVLEGRDVSGPGEAVVDRTIADTIGLAPGAVLTLRAACGAGARESLPPTALRVTGIAEFPFEISNELTIGATLDAVDVACGANARDEADMILVVSRGDPEMTAAAVRRARPDLRAATNEQMLGRIQAGGFTYFQQISTVLTTVTLAFSVLLITVLLTVSVNQRLGEIAALRALGFSRVRMAADVLSESALIVGTGGVLSLPLGAALAMWLDSILKGMPGIPAQLHFFVFQPNALLMHLSLLLVTTIIAALYPMRLVSSLPIAATLRNEVAG